MSPSARGDAVPVLSRAPGFPAALGLWALLAACAPGAPEGGAGAGSPGRDGSAAAEAAGPPGLQAPAAGADTAEPRSLEGMMTYAADAAVFAECVSGATVPVAVEGAFLELERAYLRGRSGPAEPLLVRVRGRLVPRPAMEGPARVSLVVEAVEGVDPGAGCGEPTVDLALEGTEWVLTELGGAPVPEGVEATLRLEGREGQASGTGGCNAFRGPYRLEGARLGFGNMGATRRACPGPAMETEAAYFRTLARAGGYRLVGAALELLAEEGTVARFRAR